MMFLHKLSFSPVLSLFVSLWASLSAFADEPAGWRLIPLTDPVLSVSRWKGDSQQIQTSENRGIAWKELLRLERTSERPELPAGIRLVFAKGDILVGEPETSETDWIVWKNSALNSSFIIPREQLAEMWLTPLDDRAAIRKYPALRETTRDDIVLLKNGEIISGQWSELTVQSWAKRDGALKIKVKMKEESIPLNLIAGVIFDPEWRAKRSLDTPHRRIVLMDGSRFTFAELQFDREQINGVSVFRSKGSKPLTVALPLAAIHSIDVLQEGTISLGSLKPSKYEYSPTLGEDRSWIVDRNRDGSLLRVAGDLQSHRFDRGVLIPVGGRLTYSLDGRYTRFVAEIGPPAGDEVPTHANVRVLIDGKAAEGFPWEVGGKLPAARKLSLNVSGAKELIFEISPAAGRVGGYVVFGEARLVKK